MPALSGLWSLPNSNGQGANQTNLQYSGATYNYPDKTNKTLTLTCTEVHTINDHDYCEGCGVAPIGGVFFIGDWLSELIVNKLSAFFTVLFYILTPANFNVLGYTLDDIGGQALMVVIALYTVCYVAIGALIYKIVSPFSGAS